MAELAPPASSDEPIWNAWLAAFHAPALAIADELGVFAALARAPATAAELAATLQIEERATETLLGLATAQGFLSATGGRFALAAPAREYLLPDSPYYWGPLLRRIRETPLDCRRLVESLRRGRAAADGRVTGMWVAPEPPPAEVLVGFTHAMHAHSFGLAMRSIERFDLAATTHLLDVAGGSGSYSIAAALRYPTLRATVLDLPAVCEVTRSYAARHGVGDRVGLAPADMFRDRWPTGHDRILMSDIFHDWDDERCVALARRAREALAPGGKLLVHEMVLDDDKTGPLAALAYSMVMVFVAQGRQRSVREIVELLERAGFADTTAQPTSGGYALVCGIA